MGQGVVANSTSSLVQRQSENWVPTYSASLRKGKKLVFSCNVNCWVLQPIGPNVKYHVSNVKARSHHIRGA